MPCGFYWTYYNIQESYAGWVNPRELQVYALSGRVRVELETGQAGEKQARNQPGTPGGAKSFLRGAQIFVLCPIVLNYVQHIFPGVAKNFLGGLRAPWLRAW